MTERGCDQFHISRGLSDAEKKQHCNELTLYRREEKFCRSQLTVSAHIPGNATTSPRKKKPFGKFLMYISGRFVVLSRQESPNITNAEVCRDIYVPK